MIRRRLSFFTSASSALSAQIMDVLSECGFVAHKIVIDKWPKLGPANEDLPSVVLIENTSGYRLKSDALSHLIPSGRWFGVFTNEQCSLAADATDFVIWPATPSELKIRLDRFLAPAVESPASRTTLAKSLAGFRIIGESAVIGRLMEQVEKISRVNVTTLIEGETGTGKELIARSIHYLSARRNRPYIAVNCGAIPDGLVESELFGHERGAFTDARDARIGVIEQASGGTLFLDEVEALTTKAQVALLRFLQDNEYRPLGATTSRQADVRVVAASNSPLAELVAKGVFRSDLFYRLNILPLSLPPLRRRPEDIEPLCRYFLACLRSRYGGPAKTLSTRTMEWMRHAQWPGNVRELENVLHRAFILTEGDVLDIPGNPEEANSQIGDNEFQRDFKTEKSRVIERFEREYLIWVMTTCRGNVTRAAELSGKERRAMGKLLKKHGIGRETLHRTALGQAG